MCGKLRENYVSGSQKVPSVIWGGRGLLLLLAERGDTMAKKTPKEKVLAALESLEIQANTEVKRWDKSVNQYDADMIFNEENNLPSLPTIRKSRDIAKQEALEAREVRRLFGLAIDAVWKE